MELNYNDFCCESLRRSLERGEMVYEAVRGCIQFYVKSAWNEPDVYYRSIASYCPYCGAKLHKDLLEEYCDALEGVLGKEYCDITEDEIPEEFKSDEWWKKIGL